MKKPFKQNLFFGETIYYQGKASIWAAIVVVLKNCLWIALINFFYYITRRYLDGLVVPGAPDLADNFLQFIGSTSQYIYFIFQFLIMLFILAIFNDFIKFLSTELALTNRRIVAKFGFLKHSTLEVPLSKAGGVLVEQSILGRIFNYGDIVVVSAGDYQVAVPSIADPHEFCERFSETANEEDA